MASAVEWGGEEVSGGLQALWCLLVGGCGVKVATTGKRDLFREGSPEGTQQ